MKKIMAVLIAGTLIIGNAVAQTATVPSEKKSGKSSSEKVEKKDGDMNQKKEGNHKHHHHGTNKKPASKTGDVKSPEKK